MSSEITEKQSGRIEAIDVLRGFALLGIILVHMVEQYYAGQPPEQFGNYNTKGLLDTIFSGIIGILITGKFYMIFSFLFGLSFYLQLSKSDGSLPFLARFGWRLLILFGIGLLHHLHYRGDILTIYALLGIGLLLFYRLPDKYLLTTALVLVFNIPAFLTRAYGAIFFPDQNPFPDANQSQLLTYFNTVKSGPYLEIMKANYYEFATKMNFQLSSGRIYITMGLFLLGHYAGRKKLFENLLAYTPFLRKAIRYSLWSLLGCVLFALAFFGGAELLKFKLPNIVQWMVGGLVFDSFNAAQAALYTSLVLVLFQKEKWKKKLMHLYLVGRMGLTTYLMQTVFGFFIFFSLGLQLLGEIGAAISVGLALVLFTVQIIFAKFWFWYFRFGFFEWVWRCLTYFKIQPLRKPEPAG